MLMVIQSTEEKQIWIDAEIDQWTTEFLSALFPGISPDSITDDLLYENLATTGVEIACFLQDEHLITGFQTVNKKSTHEISDPHVLRVEARTTTDGILDAEEPLIQMLSKAFLGHARITLTDKENGSMDVVVLTTGTQNLEGPAIGDGGTIRLNVSLITPDASQVVSTDIATEVLDGMIGDMPVNRRCTPGMRRAEAIHLVHSMLDEASAMEGVSAPEFSIDISAPDSAQPVLNIRCHFKEMAPLQRIATHIRDFGSIAFTE
jgi:hypothetical protein